MRSTTRILPALLPLLAATLLGPQPSAADFIGISFAGTVSRFDETTATGQVIGPSGVTRVNAMAGGPGQDYFVVHEVSGGEDGFQFLAGLDPATGLATSIGQLPFFSPGLALTPDDQLYAIQSGRPLDSDEFNRGYFLHEIDPATAASTLIGRILDTDGGMQSLEAGADGTLYSRDSRLGLIRIDPATGAGTVVDPNPVTPVRLMQGLAFSPDGTLYGVKEEFGDDPSFNTEIYTIDLTTGTATLVGVADPDDTRGIAFVPEPRGLFLAQLAVLGGFAWRLSPARRGRLRASGGRTV